MKGTGNHPIITWNGLATVLIWNSRISLAITWASVTRSRSLVMLLLLLSVGTLVRRIVARCGTVSVSVRRVDRRLRWRVVGVWRCTGIRSRARAIRRYLAEEKHYKRKKGILEKPWRNDPSVVWRIVPSAVVNNLGNTLVMGRAKRSLLSLLSMVRAWILLVLKSVVLRVASAEVWWRSRQSGSDWRHDVYSLRRGLKVNGCVKYLLLDQKTDT